MIQPNAKIEKLNGIRFYDQDIIFDDFVYNDYAELVLDVDYAMPGFGFVLINSTSSIITDDCEAFLFRIGFREASIEYKSGTVYQTILTIPTDITPSIDNHIKIKFTKHNKDVFFVVDNDTIFGQRHYKLPKTISKFCIGIYSNAGNAIRSISSNSLIPDYWNINMYNTIGGRIKFFDSGFSIYGCNEKAEIEQFIIPLSAGTYYLKYTMSDDSDIECYVFKSDDTSIVNKEKNILSDNNSFVLESDTNINIKFVGTTGTVSNIILNTDPDAKYVSTEDDDINVEESSIIVNKNGLSKITFTGTIDSLYSSTESYILSDGDNVVYYSDELDLHQEYTYEYSISDHILTVRTGDDLVYISNEIISDASTVTLFYNVDAVITDFTITKENGDTINYITSDTETRSISINRNAPIVITDEAGEPLDISSSYRIYTTFDEDNNILYDLDHIAFTNIEREIFEPQVILRTASYINNKLNAIRIFGIKEDINYDYLYRVERNDNDIGLCCNYNYELIDGDKYTLSSNGNELHLTNVDLDEYKYLVVDYLKDDSYAINPNFENNTYEIDISTNKSIMYYFDVNDSLLSDYMIVPFSSFETNTDSYYLCIRNNEAISNTEVTSL